MEEYAHFLAKLDEYQKGVEEEYPLSSTIPTQEHLKAASKLIEHEITKLSLLLQYEQAQEAFFESMEKSLDKLFAIFTNLSGYAGPTLRKQLRFSFGITFASVRSVVLEFQHLEEEKKRGDAKGEEKTEEKGGKEDNGEEKKEGGRGEKEKGLEVRILGDTQATEGRPTTSQLVGMVWEHARGVGDLALSNHVAIAHEIRMIAQLLKDAYEEVSELTGSNELGEGFEDEELTEKERERVGPIAQFTKANFTLLERVAQRLQETAAERIDGEQGAVEKLEELLSIADQISKYTDDVCVGMYPPQNEDQIKKDTTDLRRQVDTFLDVIETLDKEIPKLNAKKLVGVVRALVESLTKKICAKE